jgi:hypothetical protein
VRGLYFAYGSNMHLPRLLERAPSARRVALGEACDHRFAWNKLGRDGSAKANLVPAPGESAWGVVFAIAAADWQLLDGFEPDYERRSVQVRANGETILCETYVSEHLVEGEVPRPWYRELVLRGARENGLPPEWLRTLARAEGAL